MDLFLVLIAILLGYLFGSVPFALVIGKVFFKKDIRQYGSGNLGGTNAGRVLGKPIGVLVTVLDVLKAFLAMFVCWLLKANQNIVLLAGFAASIGHAFPLFANFKGGKSVSTYFGFLLGISVFILKTPWVFVASFFVWLFMVWLKKYVSLASMVATTFGSLMSFFFVNGNYLVSIALLTVSSFIIYRHKANIQRIKNGSESKVTWI